MRRRSRNARRSSLWCYSSHLLPPREAGRTDIICLLLQHGADPNAPSQADRPIFVAPLMEAVLENDVNTVEALVQDGGLPHFRLPGENSAHLMAFGNGLLDGYLSQWLQSDEEPTPPDTAPPATGP